MDTARLPALAAPGRQFRTASFDLLRPEFSVYAAAMTTDTDIQLSGPFKATDGSGRAYDIKGIRIFDEGYGIIDVYVDFAAAIDGTLYKDKTLVGHILARLRSLGYVGPDFGHGDLGLQDKKLIVLEAPEEFNAFAAGKGWKNLAEEFDDEE
ncbi:MAG TPA: hypothetical protein VGP06_12245 [Janthinobacterium sp.]|nr:hypothetical protein [Janthinobacterium sp.]